MKNILPVLIYEIVTIWMSNCYIIIKISYIIHTFEYALGLLASNYCNFNEVNIVVFSVYTFFFSAYTLQTYSYPLVFFFIAYETGIV